MKQPKSKKVLHNTLDERKKEYSTNVRVARNHTKKLGLPAKPLGYDLINRPSTHEELVALANELIAWAELEDSNNINDFAKSKKINPYYFKRFDNDYFQDCLERVKYHIASKNRKALIKQKFNEKLYFYELPYLDRDVKEYNAEIASQKLDVSRNLLHLGNITLVDSMLGKE